jgi:hypothetical protein
MHDEWDEHVSYGLIGIRISDAKLDHNIIASIISAATTNSKTSAGEPKQSPTKSAMVAGIVFLYSTLPTIRVTHSIGILQWRIFYVTKCHINYVKLSYFVTLQYILCDTPVYPM